LAAFAFGWSRIVYAWSGLRRDIAGICATNEIGNRFQKSLAMTKQYTELLQVTVVEEGQGIQVYAVFLEKVGITPKT